MTAVIVRMAEGEKCSPSPRLVKRLEVLLARQPEISLRNFLKPNQAGLLLVKGLVSPAQPSDSLAGIDTVQCEESFGGGGSITLLQGI